MGSGKMHASVLYNTDGSLNTKGGEGKLLAWFRSQPHATDTDRVCIQSSRWLSTWDLKVTHVQEHRVTDAPTRKSGICQQVDPRKEWIEHKRKGKRHYYRHVWTRGHLPSTYSTDDAVRLELRMLNLYEGRRVPPATNPTTRTPTPWAAGKLFDDAPRPY